jgi:hypothetical protein
MLGGGSEAAASKTNLSTGTEILSPWPYQRLQFSMTDARTCSHISSYTTLGMQATREEFLRYCVEKSLAIYFLSLITKSIPNHFT